MLTWSDLWSFLLQWAFCALINPLSFMLTYLTDHSCRPISAREKSLRYWKINIFLHFLSCRWPQKEALRILATLFMWICVVPCWPCPARPVRQEPGLVVLETLLGLVTTVEHKSSSGPSDSHYQRIDNRERNKFLSVLSFLFVEACVAERLTPRTPDPEVQGSNLASHAGVFRGGRICGEGRNTNSPKIACVGG